MEFQIERFKKLIEEGVAEGYGEVNFKVVIKQGKIDYISLTKSNIFKILNKE